MKRSGLGALRKDKQGTPASQARMQRVTCEMQAHLFFRFPFSLAKSPSHMQLVTCEMQAHLVFFSSDPDAGESQTKPTPRC